MITATNTEVKGQMGNRVQFAITLSDGRTMTTTAKTEKDAVKTILKHVNASAAPAMTPVQEMCELIYATTGVWSVEHTNLIARIHTAAHEQGNDMVDSIAHQLMKSHAISPAQASVLGRFAIANNITL